MLTDSKILFPEACPVCGRSMPPNNLCCRNCMDKAPAHLRIPFFRALKDRDRAKTAKAGAAILDRLKS